MAVTPLPEDKKPKFLEGLIADALDHGATLANAAEGGGALAGALMTPAIVDGVTPAMRLFHEEQFGPVVYAPRRPEPSTRRAASAANALATVAHDPWPSSSVKLAECSRSWGWEGGGGRSMTGTSDCEKREPTKGTTRACLRHKGLPRQHGSPWHRCRFRLVDWERARALAGASQCVGSVTAT